MGIMPWDHPAIIQYKADEDLDKALRKAGFDIYHGPLGITEARAILHSEKEQRKLWEKLEREIAKLPNKKKRTIQTYGGFGKEVSLSDIDKLCRNPIKMLWKKGYITRYSCEGHKYDKQKKNTWRENRIHLREVVM